MMELARGVLPRSTRSYGGSLRKRVCFAWVGRGAGLVSYTHTGPGDYTHQIEGVSTGCLLKLNTLAN